MAVSFEELNKAEEELEKILQGESRYTISLLKDSLRVNITASDETIIRRIKKKVQDPVNGIKVDVRIVGPVTFAVR